MKVQEILERYVSICCKNLMNNKRVLTLLKSTGIYESFVFENFALGYSDGRFLESAGDNVPLNEHLDKIGIVKNGKELFKSCITIPIYDENNAVENIIGYPIYANSKKRLIALNDAGIFNQSFLKNVKEIIFTKDPLDALLLIQSDYPNTTFLHGDDSRYIHFIKEYRIKKTIFTFDGKMRLFYELSKNGVSAKRVVIDFQKVKKDGSKEYLNKILSGKDGVGVENTADIIQEIENGFLFQLPHLNYRIIGNFSEYTMNMKANIKVYNQNDVFVDSIDLYKNRDRQNFIYNIMDKFSIRDQLQLENDLNQIIEVIEKHKEKKEKEKKKIKPELTEYQKDIGIRFLQNPHLIDEIEDDYIKLGYVRERKNKILLYLVMTSRLMDNPLHAILISRSGAGKSLLADITESLCPPEELESVSDLSAQALYYYGKENLKHRFIVIGEKEGSEGSDYPLRELITKKSITKAIPMKDNVTGQIKTVTIKVEGPISFVETTTSGDINPENLNRCFVIGIDESEDQTRLIHEVQRKNYTLDGFLQKKDIDKIISKHIYAQRLLKKVLVFNPYAEFLTFPTSKLKTRRDNEKFLRVINVICFLHQYQRKIKKLKLENNETIEYIECTPEDYEIAHELLSDGVLDNTLDDLPRPARKLLELIKKYLSEKSRRDTIPVDKIIFERREIREYTSWSFAQIRNNFRILKDYEYIQVIKARNGLANQYKLSCNYSDLDFLNKILTPKELEIAIINNKKEKDLNKVDIPEHSGEKVLIS